MFCAVQQAAVKRAASVREIFIIYQISGAKVRGIPRLGITANTECFTHFSVLKENRYLYHAMGLFQCKTT
jgi:hypothetical protein